MAEGLRAMVNGHGSDEPADDLRTTEGLELELRHLPGVDFVAIGGGDPLVIELGTDGSVAARAVAEAAARVAEGWRETDVEIRLVDEEIDLTSAPSIPSSLRVQLLAAVDGRVRHLGEERVELHLAHLGRRTVTYADHDDPTEVAEAALAGLRDLGFRVPFDVETALALPDDLGAGILVVLVDWATGERRRGIANGRSTGETVTRAVLNGLNRYLQPIERRPDRPLS